MPMPSGFHKAKAWFLTQKQPIQYLDMPRSYKKYCYDLEREGFLVREEYHKECPDQVCKRRKMVQYYVDTEALPIQGS